MFHQRGGRRHIPWWTAQVCSTVLKQASPFIGKRPRAALCWRVRQMAGSSMFRPLPERPPRSRLALSPSTRHASGGRADNQRHPLVGAWERAASAPPPPDAFAALLDVRPRVAPEDFERGSSHHPALPVPRATPVAVQRLSRSKACPKRPVTGRRRSWRARGCRATPSSRRGPGSCASACCRARRAARPPTSRTAVAGGADCGTGTTTTGRAPHGSCNCRPAIVSSQMSTTKARWGDDGNA